MRVISKSLPKEDLHRQLSKGGVNWIQSIFDQVFSPLKDLPNHNSFVVEGEKDGKILVVLTVSRHGIWNSIKMECKETGAELEIEFLEGDAISDTLGYFLEGNFIRLNGWLEMLNS